MPRPIELKTSYAVMIPNSCLHSRERGYNKDFAANVTSLNRGLRDSPAEIRNVATHHLLEIVFYHSTLLISPTVYVEQLEHYLDLTRISCSYAHTPFEPTIVHYPDHLSYK